MVPFPAGGGSDVIGRIVAQKLTERFGQQVIVDNRAGAGGSIGTEAAVKSTPDGYTVVLASTSEIAINPSLYSKLNYDTGRTSPRLRWSPRRRWSSLFTPRSRSRR